MSSLRIRPRFKHVIEAEKEDLQRKIHDALQQEELLTYTVLPGHTYIRIDASHQHFWSPQLHLTFQQENKNVIIGGLYGPNPALWAVFFFGYVVIGLLSLFVGMWGFAQHSLGMDSTILWAIPGLGFIGLVLYLASQAGQKMGAQQMFDIHHFYERFSKDRVLIN